PQVLTRDVSGQAHDTLHVVAVVLAGHGPRADFGHVAEQQRIAAGPLDRDRLDLGDRVHDLVGDLDLHLVADACLGVGPVVRDNEAARRGRRYQGARDLGYGDVAEAGLLAVDLDAHGRVV